MSVFRLIHGDSKIIIPQLIAENLHVDAIITDPPYGINFEYNDYDDSLENWISLMLNIVPHFKELASFIVMPAAAIDRLKWWYTNLPPDWLISWYKGSPGHNSKIGFNSWEPLVCFGKPKKVMPDAFTTTTYVKQNGHPCPKPLGWARWLVTRATRPGDLILDPFMGSGTVGVACMQTDRDFIGIEMDIKYFSIAKKRIEKAAQQPTLLRFDKYTQKALF